MLYICVDVYVLIIYFYVIEKIWEKELDFLYNVWWLILLCMGNERICSKFVLKIKCKKWFIWKYVLFFN